MAIADTIRESMSAVADGEGTELDLARVLRAVEEQPEARQYWQRLQESRSVLRTGQAPHSIDVSGAVMASLTNQPPRSRQVGPLGSLAVAASVTFAVVFGGQALLGQPPAIQDALVASSAVPGGIVPVQGAAPVQARFGASQAPVVVTAQEPRPSSATAAAYEQLTRERFERYGLQHAEATAHLQSNTFVPFARVPEHRAGTSEPAPDRR